MHTGLDAIVYSKDCASLEPGEFKKDIIDIVAASEYTMFCVDDTIFIDYFDVGNIQDLLRKHKKAIGFSLRLGKNTDYCYMKDRKQRLPEFFRVEYGCLKYNWVEAELDFAYPLEISSSVYRRDDILNILTRVDFDTPTRLEVMLHRHKFLPSKSFLLCYWKSVAVSVPWNMVQDQSPNNRHGSLSEDYLDRLYSDGKRIDVEAYRGITTNAVHQELPLRLEGEK